MKKVTRTYYGAGDFTLDTIRREALEGLPMFVETAYPDGHEGHIKTLKGKITKEALRKFLESPREQGRMTDAQNEASDILFYARQEMLDAFLESLDNE